MVKMWSITFFLLFALFFNATIFAEDIKVVSEVDQSEAYVNEPLKGTISITHNKNHTVDLKSFLLGKNQLAVELIKEVQIAPNDPLMLSIYSFKIPGQPQGLYALPAVSVRVGGKVYQSTMSSYTVEERKKGRISSGGPVVPQSAPARQPSQVQPPSQATSTSSSPLLRLEAGIDGNSSIYPGQRTKLTYHYYFSGDIALTTETLPLLDAEGFIKIGEKEINDSIQGTTSVREIAQQVEAIKPGNYSFGPSLIEGYAYKEDPASGNPIYTSDKLSSKAPPVTISVMPFPELKKPASFNGAVGQYTFKSVLVSPAVMTLGDEISLSLEITGKGNLKNVKAPDLCCQPGYSGFFRLSDLPPSEEVDGGTKKILVKLRPLNAQIKTIPSIEFSFFDPETAQYVVLHGEEIPITIKPSGQPNAAEIPQANPAVGSPSQPAMLQTKPSSVPHPIEVESILPLTTDDLYNKLFGTWWVLAMVPLGIALLIFQSHLKEYLIWQRSQVPLVTSQQLFDKAFLHEKQGKCDVEALKKSFKLRLVEAGLLSSIDISDDELLDEGLPGEVKKFWAVFDEKRFAGKGAYDVEEIHQLSQALMSKIYVVSKKNGGGL